MSDSRWIKIYGHRGIEWIDTKRENDHTHAYNIRINEDRIETAICRDCHESMPPVDMCDFINEWNESQRKAYENSLLKE